jgi:uncharacterized protein YkwD
MRTGQLRPIVGAVLFAVFLVSALCRATTAGAVDPTLRQLWEAHNQARAKRGLPALVMNPQLMAAAREHAHDMAARRTLTHEGTDGSTPDQRIERQGYHSRQIGENVAAGQQTVQEVMQSWMQSPLHRRNILGDFSDIGVARAFDSDGAPYWCVVFGQPASSS